MHKQDIFEKVYVMTSGFFPQQSTTDLTLENHQHNSVH